MTGLDPELLSWVMLGNPLSATLTGPWLAARVSPLWARRAQGAGWIVLAITQLGLVVFGATVLLTGFQVGPVLMVGVSLMNVWAWYGALAARRRNPPQVIERLEIVEMTPTSCGGVSLSVRTEN